MGVGLKRAVSASIAAVALLGCGGDNGNPGDGVGTATYLVTVSSAGRGAVGGGSYAADVRVDISAGTAPSGCTFDNWTTTSSGVTFDDDRSNTTWFTMPANAVTLMANFRGDLSYEGQAYRTVVIGGRKWMAENLNYQPLSGNSWCYNDDTSKCNQYGRLYDWATAMGIDTSNNSSNWGGRDVRHRGICPEGWHLPNSQEWSNLVSVAGGDSQAGTKLQSRTGWYKNGTDAFGFSALPGGGRDSYNGTFYDAVNSGYWWTASEFSAVRAYHRRMYSEYSNVSEAFINKSDGFSVRCLEN